MLFHVTLTHTEDNCPAYHRERMPQVLEAFENLEALGADLKVKIHYFTWTPTDHTAYLLLETEKLSSISKLVFSIPFEQQSKIVPVEPLSETVAMAKAITAKG